MKVFSHCERIVYGKGTSPKAFQIVALLVSLYTALVISFSFGFKPLHRNYLLAGAGNTVALFAVLYYLITLFAYYLSHRSWIIIRESKLALSWKSFLFTFFLISLPFIANYLYWFPGINNLDTIGQWEQVKSFQFNDWHPAIHTFIIWCISRIYESYAFVVLIQNLFFCLALTYLFSTLERWGIPTKLLYIVFCLIVLTPIHQVFLQWLLKDCAFTIATTIATAKTLDVFFCAGKLRLSSAIVFGILLGIATLIRHNAFLYTFPLFLIMLINYRKNTKMKYATLAFLATVLIIRWPLYSALKVTYPNNTVGEAVGLPMTILGDIYILNPDGLDDETKEFLLSFADDKTWRTNYILGDFDSIKWVANTDYNTLNSTSPRDYTIMTLNAKRHSPQIAFEAVRQLTSCVWSISDQYYFHTYYDRESIVNNSEYDVVGDYSDNIVTYTIGNYMRTVLQLPLIFTPTALCSNIGLCLLLLLLSFAVTYPRNGTRSLVVLLPILVYSFCTMLILSSPWEHRIFHFILVLSWPIIIVMFTNAKSPQSDSENEFECQSTVNGI